MFSVNKFNENIHGMRGLAALFVFLVHIYHNMIPFFLDFNVATESTLQSIKLLVNTGSSGVEIFFVISGYLITGSLLRHKNISSFLMDRAIRIYPVFLSIHIPLFIILPLIGWKWLGGVEFSEWVLYFLSNLFFLPGVFDLKILQTNAWTLSYELLFYLLSCVVYASLNYKSSTVLKVTLAVCVALIICMYPRGVYFVAGTALYFTLRQYPQCFQYRFLNSDLMFLLVLILLGPCRSLLPVEGNPIHSTDIATKLAVVPMFLMFLGVVRSKGLLSLLLRTKVMQYFGGISYSLYLWHAIILSIGNRFVGSAFFTEMGFYPGISLFVLFAIEVVLVVIVSNISYNILELRLADWLKSKKNKLKFKRNVDSIAT